LSCKAVKVPETTTAEETTIVTTETTKTTETTIAKIQYDDENKPKIIFSSELTGQWELFAMDIDGNNLVQLTDSKVAEYHARYSPDGKKIVFVSDRDTEINSSPYPITSIYMMDIDGASENKLKQDSYSNYSDYDPCISPDGNYMVFSSSRTNNDEIYIMNLSDRSTTNLTNNEEWDGRPQYSPDGNNIVFNSDRGNKSAYMDIYMMDLTGKNVVKLTESISWDSRNPCFSTDGKWIVFSSDEDGDSDIYLLDPLGKGMINLTNNNVNDYYPSFSP
jgi:TolB protein